MDFNEYQEKAHQTSSDLVIGHPIIYPTLGLVNEAGEFAGKVKKIFRDRYGAIDSLTELRLKSELGDVLWYLSEIATQMDWSLGDVATDNLWKLQQRKANNTIHGDGDER